MTDQEREADRTLSMMEYEDWRAKRESIKIYADREFPHVYRIEAAPHHLGCGCPICTPPGAFGHGLPKSIVDMQRTRSFWYEFLGRLMP